MRTNQRVQRAQENRGDIIRTTAVALAGLFALTGLSVAHADPLNLFTNIVYSADGSSPPPEDSLAVYDSAMDIAGLAGMP